MRPIIQLIVLCLLYTVSFAIKGVGLNPIKPFQLNKNQTTKYLFSIMPETQILTKAKIRVKFPSEFIQSHVASNLNCMMSSVSNGWRNVPCAYFIDSVVVSAETILDEETKVLISSPKNPTNYSMSAYIQICLLNGNSISSCNKQFGKVVFADPPISVTGTALMPKVTSLTSVIVGQASTYQFTFDMSQAYSRGNTIRITFPSGFSTSSNPICQMGGTYSQIIQTFVWPDNRSIECQAINKTIHTGQSLKIIGIYNPHYQGIFGGGANMFKIQLLENTTTIVREQIYIVMTVTINHGTLIGNIVQTNNFIKAKAKYNFYLGLQNALGSQNYIQLRFSKSWILYSNQCAVISGIVLNGKSLICKNSSDSTYSYLKIYNFDSASVSTQLVFSTFVGSPSAIGSYNVRISTKNSDGTMDQLDTSVILNSTYGTLEMLSINAITANQKVPVAGTGPLQLTFFLNYLLPQTNVLTEGVFYVKIFPQIPLPISSINGVLKCYFFNDIPAETCTWDLTDPDFTLLTIKTPLTTSFQYSQIPITITTEGAVNESMIGITIDDKVTRYRFQMQAYKQTNATTPTEVYYTQYIADAINLPLTAYSLTNEINQYTHLRFDFTVPYNFIDPLLVPNLRLKIEFLSGGGWAPNLGYTADQVYKQFPCAFTDDQTVFPPTYKSEVKCDLYTYLQGPHASLTQNQRGPYILVYGFITLPQNNQARLQLGKFLISNNAGTATKIRFSIIEETPEMLTKYIQLYYNQFTVFTTASQSIPVAASTGITFNMASSTINTNNAHSYSMTTAGTQGFAITYQYDRESTPSFTNSIFNCSTSNTCIMLGYPVNWVIQYSNIPGNLFSNSISSFFYNLNGKYGGTFHGQVRVYSNAKKILLKSAYNIVYTPVGISSQLFYGNSLKQYKATQEYYTVRFYPNKNTPDNGFIRLTFGNQIVLGITPYCSSAQLQAYVQQLGILCSIENNQKTLKIYNIRGLSTSTLYYIQVRLLSTQTSVASSFRPSVSIQAYYTIDVDYSVVNQYLNLLLNDTLTNYYNAPQQFVIPSPRMSLQIPRINYVGKFQIQFQPSSDSTNAKSIKITMNNHPWNGGYWSTPNQISSDPIVCLLNTVRVPCTFSLSPLIITLDISQAGMNLGIMNQIVLDTQYLYPQNGIRHPAKAGQYLTNIEFIDASNLVIQKTSFYHRVKPSKLRTFWGSSTVNDIGQQNMFIFEIQVDPNIIYPNSYFDSTYSRIFIDFPTIDANGNSLFANNLGGYTKTGQYVGCYFQTGSGYIVRQSSANNLRCRLIMSEVTGEPTTVEIINHRSFYSSRYTLKVYMARIFNPTVAVTSVPITVRINHVTTSNNNVEELYEDTYDVFMNTLAATPATDTSATCVGNSFQDTMNLNDDGWFRIYPKIMGTTVDSTNGFYYVMRLTSDFKPMNSEDRTPHYCTNTYHVECFAFTDINYMIIHNRADNYDTYFDVYSPQAISQSATTYTNLVWQNGRYLGKHLFTVSTSCWWQMVGSMSSVTISQVESTNANRLSRRRAQVYVRFTTTNYLPADGTIQIVWPSNVATFPHCHSATAIGSSLFASGSSQSGQVGCLVQGTNSWVITSFQGLGPSTIIIQGQVTLPGTYSTLGTGQIITYNNTHDTDIRANGFIIDYWSSNFQIYVQNESSWNVDSQITLQQTLPLRINHVGPLQFKFKLGSDLVGANVGKMQVKLAKKSTSNQNGGFTVDTTKKHVCQFTQIISYQKIGCIVTAVTDDTTLNQQNVKFDIISSSTLLAAKTYAFKLTTLTGLTLQGLSHPTVAGTYKIDVNFDTSGSTNYGMHNQLYLEVYGTPFTKLNVISFMSNQGQNNLIWLDISPTTIISLTDQLIIQVPTRSSNGQTLFANDLGLALSDGANFIYDIIQGTFFGISSFMECRLYHGDQNNYKPAKIICGKFKQTISSTQNLFMAIKIINPTISPDQLSVPFFVYTFSSGISKKTNFNVVENAVFIRTNPSSRSDQGDLYSSSQALQTPNSWIRFITRHYYNIQIGEYYVVQFKFPLRVNGKVGSCYYNSTYTYGDTYYHQNLWFIVCHVTTNAIGVPGSGSVTRNLYINGFYTPWYLLSTAQRVVTTYAYHHLTRYTQKGVLSDYYPLEGPKYSTSSPTFTMTPIYQTPTMYQGARDDYKFSIIFDTSGTVDISYMKLIAIIFPSGVYGLEEQDCTEASTSQVQIQQCWIETSSNRVIWIRPVVKNTYTSNLRIDIVTQNLAIRNPLTTPIDLDTFTIKFYSWENISEPSLAPLSNNNYCFLIMTTDKVDFSLSYTLLSASFSPNTFDYINFPHQRYYLETPYSEFTHRSPFEMEFMPSVSFGVASGANYHQIKLFYPSTFDDTAKFMIRDLEIFKPICYLNNFRIRKCSIDTTNNFILMNFQFALTVNVSYHVYFSILDPRSPDINGFLSSAAISNVRFQYQVAGSSTIYYTESDSFPSLASLPTGVSVGPFRGISSGSVQYGHALNSRENIVVMKLNFNRTDITGLVFEIPMYDKAGNQLYSSSSVFQQAFYYVGDGEPYPCGNNGYGAGGKVKCILSLGDYRFKGTSTKIIMTDFTYVSEMNCRFIFFNPDSVGTYFSVIVKAYGGTKSSTNLYGNKYMGQWQFSDIFKTQSGSWTFTNSYVATSYRLPTKSPWRNQTTHYVFSRNSLLGSRRTSFGRFTLYASDSSYNDKQSCRAQLSPIDSDDDLLIVDYQWNGGLYRYAYFVRTWPSSANLSTNAGNGWGLNYVKCKYSVSYLGYFFFSDTDVDIVTLTFNAAHMLTLTNAFSSPTNSYLDITNRVNASNTGAYVIAQFDITALLSSISNFAFQNSDSMTLKMNWVNSGTQWWGTSITECHAIGGFISTSPQNPVNCFVANSKQFYFTNIAGFESDPYLPTNTNKRIKFMFKSTTLTYATSHSDTFTLCLYANHDAYTNNLVPIFQQSNSLKDINIWASYNYQRVVHDQSVGTLTVDQLSDTFVRLSYIPASNHGLSATTRFNFYISTTGFSYGSSCAISNIVAQIGSSTMQPGGGVNNTIGVLTSDCQPTYLNFYWSTTLSAIFSGAGASNDNTFSTSQKIIIYVTIQRGTVDLPVFHHQYAYITSILSNDQTGIVVRNTVFLDPLPLANSATLSTIFSTSNTNRNGVTELMLQLTNLKYPLGSSSENYLLLIEFLGSSSWSGTNDPFKTYINTDNLDEKIQCKCLSGIGALSSSTTSPFIDATCRRRKPTASYNAYAIIVDQTVNLNENLRCYFPQFYIFQNMVVEAEVKRINGWSYLPDINPGTKQYGSVFRITTNQLSFSGTTPNMPTSTLTISDGTYYSSTVNVGTIYSDPYTLSASWSGAYSSPYFYVNFNKAGPVPVFAFCSDPNIYFQCRVYSRLLNLVVGRVKSTSVTSFSFSKGSSTIYYPSSQFSINTDFNGVAYIGSSGWGRYGTLSRSQSTLSPISTNVFNVMADSFGSKKSSFSTTLLFAMNINGKTLYNYFLTQSKIQITYSSLTQESQCMVWVQNEPSVELTCQTSAGLIRVYSYRTDYTTSNTIWVSLGITNPTTANWLFTMKLYDYYYSVSRYSLVINTQSSYTIDNSYVSNTKIQKSRLQMYPFRSRFSSTANSPLRIQFKLNGIDISSATPGKFYVTYPQITYSSNYLCYFYEFQSFTNMIQRTQHTIFKAPCSSSSTNLNIYPPNVQTISSSKYYQLVIMPIGINAAGCGQGCQSQSGFHQTNLPQIRFSAYYNYLVASSFNTQVTKLYAFEGSFKITLDRIFYLTNEPIETSIFFQFNLNFTSAVSYPNHYLELILYDLTSGNFPGYGLNDIIPCQLSDNFAKITNRKNPQCRLAGADYLNSFVKVHIQNFGPISSGIYWVALDDITLPTPPATSGAKKFDFAIRFDSGTTRYENFFKEILVIDDTNTANPTTQSISFNNPSQTMYGSPSISGQLSFSWPFDSNSNVYESKIAININGGYSATWPSIDAVTFVDASPGTGTYQLLWVNKNLNKFVFVMPQKSSGTSTTLYINNLKNPYPYQRQAYNTNNNLQINFYQNYFKNTSNTISQPLFTIFQKNPSIIYMNQNYPANSFDIYPTNNSFSSGALIKLILSVAFEETDAQIIKRNLDTLDIQFTSGLNYIQECRVFRNNTQYAYELGTCQTYVSAGNWHIIVYGIIYSQLDVDWTIQVFATFSSATLGYTSRIKAPNGVVEYQSIYSISMASYNTTRNIPAIFSWLNRKYVKNYYQNQFRPLSAVTSQATPYLRFRVRTPYTYDGSSDYMRLYLDTSGSGAAYSAKSSTSQLICQLLPAQQTQGSFRDFTVGIFSICSMDTSGNYYYHLPGPYGGLSQYQDYLLQIQQPNIVTTSFYLPTSPRRNQLTVAMYRNESPYGGTYESSFFVDSFRPFRQVYILHTTTTVSDYDTLSIYYKPDASGDMGGSISAGSTSRQLVLRLSISGKYHEIDAGIRSIYSNDGKTFINGGRFSEVVSNPNGAQVTTLQFSQYSIENSPLYFSLSKMSAYTDNVQYQWHIPLIKNPSATYAALRYNLTLYVSDQYSLIPINHHESINQYYTVADSSASFSTSLSNTNRYVQTINGIDLQVNLNSYSVPNGDAVTFKLDNSLNGLISDFTNCNDTSNYDYLYFHTLNMVMARKKTSNTVNTVGIGTASDSINYKRDFQLKWVKVFDTSPSRMTTNPQTVRYSTPAALSLNILTSYTSSSVTLYQGPQNEGSSTMYRVQIIVPIIPQGGYIKLELDSTKISTQSNARCRVGANFARSTNDQQVLRCYRVSDGFIISGFSAIAAGTNIEIFIYIKSKIDFTNTPATAKIYGLYLDTTSGISSAVAGTITHINDSFPVSLQRVNKIFIPYFGYYPNSNYYEIEGSLKLRTTDITNGFRLYITDPFSNYGNLKLFIKLNTTAVTGWTQLTYISTSSQKSGFYIPPAAVNDINLYKGQQYVWKYRTIRANSNSGGTYDGMYMDYPGSNYQFWIQSTNSAATVTYDIGYQDFLSDPIPQLLTIENRYPAAGQKTCLRFTFIVRVDTTAGSDLQLVFDTHNLMTDMFANDLQGQNIESGETYRYLDCRQWSTNSFLSNSRLVCILYFGDNSAVPPKPARLVVPNIKAINGYPSVDTVSFMVANVKNPTTQNMVAGVQATIYQPCNNMQNRRCAVGRWRGYYTTKSTNFNEPTGTPSFSRTQTVVLADSVNHTFTVTLTSNVGTNDIIYIIYPENFQGQMPTDCSCASTYCYVFPKRRWVVLYPTTTFSSFNHKLYYMNNPYYSQPYSLNFKIIVSRGSGASLADIYYVPQPAFDTVQNSLISPYGATAMTISATQTPNIYLRNYANTAIFLLDNIFVDSRITCFYLKAPAQVTVWDQTYCNATLTNTNNFEYPYRFICRVFPDDPQFLQIIRDSEFDSYTSSWNNFRIKVHAKFTLKDFDPGQPQLYVSTPVNSGLFIAYGSVNVSSADPKYYVSQCSQLVSISQHQVPIINDITFNLKSFANRVARVNNAEIFYLLLKPTQSTPLVTEMVFRIPYQFDYPGVFSHDNCLIIGRQKTLQDKCKQSRENGSTLVKLTPTNYNNEVKIIQLGSVIQSKWFTAPNLPGDFYNMTVELYSIDGTLLQKQTVDISPVYGESFNIPDITLFNIKDPSISQSVYDLSFKTGTLQIPPGAITLATSLSSQFHFIFQSYNSADPLNVFAKDLGTGLKEGSEVGCIIHSGMTALDGKRLKCLLHIGTNSTDKPIIRIVNYDYINASTTIKISFGGIQSLPLNKVNTISIAVKLFYHDRKSQTYLYIPTAKLPSQAITSLVYNVHNPTWHSQWYFYAGFVGTNTVLQPTTLSFNMTIPTYTNISYSPWTTSYTYSTNSLDGEYILLKFTPKTMIDPNNKVPITCDICSKVQIFYAAGIIRFQHTSSSWSVRRFNFYNFPSSAFNRQNVNVSVRVQIYKDYQLLQSGTATITNRLVQKCQKFNFGVISVSSLNGGQIGVTYVFSLRTNHFIPANGAITITIPSSYGNMATNNVTCTLRKFTNTNAYCMIQTPSRVDIYANGTEFSQNQSYEVQISGLQNPNQDSSGLIFYVTSYYSDNIYLGQKICENQVTPPTITVKSIRTCTLDWNPSYHNKNFNSTYVFVLSCGDIFRGDSILYIALPSGFNTNNGIGQRYCTSYQSTTLKENKCTLSYINGTYMLTTSIYATTQTSLSIVISFINPNNGTYSANAYVMSRGVSYARASNTSIQIISNSYLTGSKNSVDLLNLPKQAGIMSTYVFKIAPMLLFTPQNLQIDFPDNFFVDQQELTIGFVLTTKSNLFSYLNYDNIQKLISNLSSVGGASLTAYPSFTVQDSKRVYITNISSIMAKSSTLQQWNYVLIRGIKNPSAFKSENFSISYYQTTTTTNVLNWFFKYPLTYYISSPPQFLSLSQVVVSDNDLLYPTNYTFVFQGQDGVSITPLNKQLSIVIVIPTFYQNANQNGGTLYCKFAELATSSPCQKFSSQIIVTETFTSSFNSLTLLVSSILNPALATYCNTTDVSLLSHTYFRIRIMDKSSNNFLFETSSIVSGSTCLEFKSIRIPISLEYSLQMVAGLAYNITYGLTKPASNLKIKASINASGFTFSPQVVDFDDYYTLTKSTQLRLRSDIASGEYTINFVKYESETQTYFRNILPATITVRSLQTSNITRPTIKIQKISVSTIGYSVQIPVLLSSPSSTPMTLFMKILQQSNQTLQEYSPLFQQFQLEPRILNITQQTQNYSFVLTYKNGKVPPRLTLNFKLTSLYPLIHNLTTPTMYLCFDRDPRYNVRYPPLRVTLAESASSCNDKDVGKDISNIYARNISDSTQAKDMRPQIIKITVDSVASTGAVLKIYTVKESTIYYLITDAGDPSISNTLEITSPQTNNYSADHRQTGNSKTINQNVYVSKIAQLNNIATVTLGKLSSSTSYVFYAVSKSQMGQSQMKNTTFTTTALSLGVLMKFTFKDIVNKLDIVKSLQKILRISPIRIKVITSNYELQLIKNSLKSFHNAPNYIYQVVIAPDPNNDIKSPYQIAQNFSNNQTNLGLFKGYMPDWDNATKVSFHQLKASYPLVLRMPTPYKIYLYNATFSIDFWDRSNIYAILIERQEKAQDSLSITQKPIVGIRVSQLPPKQQAQAPSSNQIKKGRDKLNAALRGYNVYSGTTDSVGSGKIFFNDLKPGSIYDMYITSSSILPYEPSFLWKNEDVIKVTFESLHNPNLKGSNRNIEQLKKYNPSLGRAIEKFLINKQQKQNRSK